MKIAILTPNKEAHTETFIQNHIQHLPFQKVVVYGGKFPYVSDDMQPTSKQQRAHKLKGFLRKALGKKTTSFKESQLRKILRKEQVKVVFAEYLSTGAEVVEVCRDMQIPLVAIALGYEISVYHIIEKYTEKYKALFQYAQKLVVVSRHMTQNMTHLGCDPQKIVYSPAGPSEAFFQLTPSSQEKQILAIGRFVEKKAPHITIMAFQKVLEKHPDATLVMAGDGPLWQVCKDLVQFFNIGDSVQFLGRITQEQQQELFKASYLFVQHSRVTQRGDSEGTPVVILEASAAGLPVVATLHAGIPDVIVQGETGLLSEEGEVDAMAANLIQLLENKPMAESMGAKGKQHTKAHFSLQKHINDLATVLKEASSA